MLPEYKTLIQTPAKVGVISVARGMEGGAEVVLKNLLLSYPAPKSFTLIAPENCELDRVASEKGIAWVNLPGTKDRFSHNIIAMNKVLPELKHLEIVHAWTRRSFELAAFASFRLNLLCSATLHDSLKAFCISRRRRLLMRLSMRRINPLVCVSNYLNSSLNTLNLRKQTVVIPNGVNDFSFTALQTGSREAIRIGFAGMHHPQKGFATIAKWIPKVLSVDSNISFELFGNVNPLWKDAVHQLQEQYPEKLQFRGRVPTSEVFQSVDIFVQASYPFEETFGMVLAEAACAGIPVVTSDHGAEAEVVINGETGFLFTATEPELGLNQLLLLLKNPELRSRMGRKARERYERNFQAQTMSEQYLKLWKQMAGQQQTPLR